MFPLTRSMTRGLCAFCMLLCCPLLSTADGSGTQDDAPTQQGAPRACHMSSPTRRLRILKPTNASAVDRGSWLIVRDTRLTAMGPCFFTISIDSRDWVSVPCRKSALQLRLPASLPAGMHLIQVRVEEEHEDAGRLVAGMDAMQERACVWCVCTWRHLPWLSCFDGCA